MSATVSVIIPVYNMEDYLEKCLCSVIEQTYKNIEILVIDDGSTDASSGICDTWASRDSRIRVLHKKNGGLSDARNAGLDICTGEYVVFVDSDDYIAPDYVEYLYSLIVANSADLSICEHSYVSPEGKLLRRVINDGKISVMDQKQTLAEMCEERLFSHSAWAKMYKTEHFSKIRFPAGHNFEDIATTYKLIFMAERIVVGHRALYFYLRREGSIMTAPFSWKRLDSVYYMEQMSAAIVDKWPELKAVAYRRLFAEYIACWSSVIHSDVRSKEIESLLDKLYGNIKSIRKEIKHVPMSKRTRCYYLSSYVGKWFLSLALSFEDALSQRFR